MASASKNKVIEQIKVDLFSDKAAVVSKAIQRCREEGDASLVEPLILFYGSDAPSELRQEVADLLSTLKVSEVEEYFLRALNNPELAHIQKDLLSFIWNAGLQPVKSIGEISRIAVKGDFATTLECLTILENLETEVPEEVLLDSITTVRQHLSQPEKSEKKALLVEYLQVLDDMRAHSENN